MSKGRARSLHREQIIGHLQKWLRDYERDVATCQHWNENVRKQGESPVEYDPTGELSAYAQKVRGLLHSEDARPILFNHEPPVRPTVH